MIQHPPRQGEGKDLSPLLSPANHEVGVVVKYDIATGKPGETLRKKPFKGQRAVQSWIYQVLSHSKSFLENSDFIPEILRKTQEFNEANTRTYPIDSAGLTVVSLFEAQVGGKQAAKVLKIPFGAEYQQCHRQGPRRKNDHSLQTRRGDYFFDHITHSTQMNMKMEDYKRKNAELERLVAAQKKELDIKNRELEVEAALERVRAASLAMKESSELPIVALVLINQLAELNVQQLGSSIVIIDEEKETYRQYSAHDNLKDQEKILNTIQDFHLNEIHFGREILGLARSDEKDFTIELRGEPLREWMTYVKNKVHEQRGEAMLQAGLECIYFHFAKFHGVSSIVISTLQPLPDADRDILRRMANTFGSSYLRHLDLQKAEAQVREARIEAALERVRGRTMAMRKSEELAETAFLMFHQLKELGLAHNNCGFVILNPDDLSGESWLSGGEVVNETVPWRFDIDPDLRSVYEAWKKGSDFFEVDLSGEAFKRHYQNIEAYFRTLDFKPKLMQAADVPRTRIIGQHAFFSHGFLLFHFDAPNTETTILKRFARLFEQTYTRFLDLKKAEAQAREAQIEMTLERVRSRTMAMQKSEELMEVVDTIFGALEQLEYNPLDCTIVTFDHDSRKMDCWSSMPTGQGISSFSYSLPYIDHPMLNKMFLYHREQKPFLIYHLAGEEKVTYDDLFFEAVPIPEMEAVLRAITETTGNFIFMSHGAVAAFTPEPMSESDLALLQRFSKVVDLSYTRFLDLKKAEAQAREAQIEASLERVRARTMAMHRSEELTQIASQIYVELEALGIKPWAFGFNIWMADQAATEAWSCSGSPDIKWEMVVPHTEDPSLKKIYSHKNAGKPIFKDSLQGKVLQQHLTYMASLSGLSEVMDDILEAKGTLPEPLFLYAAYFKQGYLLLTSLAESAEVDSILIKFANVFEQTYTRFLDLQKAEAQAREAQIEAAMERIRSRSLAMRSSEEIMDVITEIRRQIDSLGQLDLEASVVHLYTPGAPTFESIAAVRPPGESGEIVLANVFFPVDAMARIEEMIAMYWSDATEYTLEFNKEMAEEWQQVMLKHAPMIANRRVGFVENRRISDHAEFWNFADFSGGSLLLVTHSPASEDTRTVLRKAAQVFDLAYRRFRDLQQAEAQAREAKIEAALERVRGRTMAMKHSDELAETSFLLANQVRALGIQTWGCAFNIYDEDQESSTEWFSSENGSLPMYKTPREGFFLRYYEAGQRGESLFVEEVSGAACAARYQFMSTLPGMGDILKKAAASGISLPTSQVEHAAYFKYGYLLFITYEPVPEAHDIFIRFAKVFEQTYTRFLDLRKAEARVREAQIEAALDRVRARTMAMHHSNELLDCAQLLFQQLEVLGFELTVCGFSIIDKNSPKGRHYISIDGTLFPEPLPIQYDEDIQFRQTYKEWKDGKSSLILDIQGEELKRHLAYNLSLFKNLNSIEVLSNTTEKFNKKTDQQPDRLVVHHAFFEHGALFLSHNKPVGDIDVLVRFAKVFEQTYTRFLDLQKAEVHAREAARQASIDRVRAEIASMRTAEDLEHITPLIWRELTTLGVPFFRCGVFIIREPDELVHAYLSTPEGHSLAVLHLPFDGAETTRNIVDNWRRQHIYADHWDRSQFQAWVQSMVDEGQLSEVQQYQAGETPPESLSLQFIPFIQGMLYVGSNDPLSEDQLVLVKSLADAFSVAYARYEDFNKLELAKNRVESTLTELKATQTQLIQQEKLASLGQLTAGIAHEIKNPLNFVTNFSEVSKELLEEMREEINKGDWAEVNAIAADLEQNLEKIHHHGSRADSIVQSMLLHSRGGSGEPERTDLNAFIREYVNLAYHGMRAGKEPINVSIDLALDEKAGLLPLVVEDFSRVILNLCQNAFDAMRSKLRPGNEKAYQPKLAVRTRKTEEGISIEVADNGPGIPEAIRDKILQPFFTTKKGTEGTGLGLSISNDIVKAHGGTLKVETKEIEGTAFIIGLPLNG